MRTVGWYVVYLIFEVVGLAFGLIEVVTQRHRYHIPGWR